MSTVVDQHCVAMREQGATMTTDELKTSFDVFVSELKKIDTPSQDVTLIKQIVSVLVNLPNKSKCLAESDLIGNQFIIFLRDCVVDQLRQRQSKDVVHDLLIDLSTLFANICRHINDTNIFLFKQLLLHKPLVDELVGCFDEIGTNGMHLDNPHFLSSLRLLLMAFQNFEKKQSVDDGSSLTTQLLLAVLKCLCSSYTVDTLTGLERNFEQNLTERQILLLNTCPLFLQWFSGTHNPELFLQIPRALLGPFTLWATNCHSDSIIHCSHDSRDMMRHLNFMLVRPIEWETANVSNQEFYNDYCRLVSQWSSLLQITIRHSSDASNLTPVTRFIVQDLYNFTLHPNVLSFMKTISTLIPTLLKTTDVQQDETQLNAYRCLGKIMTEEDIKTMANPSKIAIIYVKFLSKAIDDPKKKERFTSLLDSLKNWVQHDQVKVHLVDQKVLPLLVRSIMETKFDPMKIQQPSLEILLALSFNKDAFSYLKQNRNFMNHIRNLSSNNNSSNSSLQRAAEGLLWKLEKETEAVAKPAIPKSYEYDIMISYSHGDKQLCYPIHEQLVKDGFRVWIDREHMHGATMAAMADAIENSDIVLICMSDSYKQSAYCQSEAHYAFERGRCLIPLIMKPRYKPDGWLGIIASGKIYVDLVKLEFNLAYDKLKSEIHQHRQRNTGQTAQEKDHHKSSGSVAPPLEETSQSVEQYSAVDLPHCVSQWTRDHVRSFLTSIGVKNTLLTLCIRMDGHRLLQLYEMCLMNRESMFQSLKAELAEGHHKLLPINDYVTFLQEIKKYVPLTPAKLKTTESDPVSSTICSIM